MSQITNIVVLSKAFRCCMFMIFEKLPNPISSIYNSTSFHVNYQPTSFMLQLPSNKTILILGLEILVLLSFYPIVALLCFKTQCNLKMK